MAEHRRIQFTAKHRKQFDDDLVLTNNRKGREGISARGHPLCTYL